MLNLLITVSLDSADQGLNLLIMFLYQNCLFFLYSELEFSLKCSDNFRFLLFYLLLAIMNLLVIFNANINFLLFLQIYNFLRPFILFIKLNRYWFYESPHLFSLFLLELINQLKGCIFVIAHIFIPCLCKLYILLSLSGLNSYQFPLLGYFHIIFLSFCLLISPILKNYFELISFQIFVIFLAQFSNMVCYFQ